MKSSTSLFYKIGFLNTLYDWRFLVILFLVALIAVWYMERRGRDLGPSLYAVMGVLFVYGLLYYLDMVPHMNWFIPLKDPSVASVIYYQSLAYAAVFVVALCYYFFYARREVYGGLYPPGQREKGLNLYLPLVLIIAFAVGQQVYGFTSEFWLYQESDSPRYFQYSLILLRDGFKAFVDTWMLPINYYQMYELDMPLVPFLWVQIYKNVAVVFPGQFASDITSHILSLSYWSLSLWGTFLLGRELFDRRVGSYAALFLALVPYYSFLGYLYMADVPFTAMVTITAFFAVRAVKRNSIGYGFLTGIFLVLAILTKSIALYMFGPFTVFYLLFRTKRQWKPEAAFFIAFAAGLSVLLGILIYYYGGDTWQIIADFIERKKRIAGVESLRMRQGYVSLYHRGIISAFFYVRYITAFLGFGILLLALVSVYFKFKGKLSEAKEHIFLILWPMGLLIYFSFSLTKSSRWLWSGYPAVAILAACGLVALSEKTRDRGAVYIVLALVVVEMIFRHISFYQSLVSKLWILTDYAVF